MAGIGTALDIHHVAINTVTARVRSGGPAIGASAGASRIVTEAVRQTAANHLIGCRLRPGSWAAIPAMSRAIPRVRDRATGQDASIGAAKTPTNPTIPTTRPTLRLISREDRAGLTSQGY